MKQTISNQFSKGLNLDLHPLVAQNTMLTDNLNGTYITYDGNEFCLQNDRGNVATGATLKEGYVPIGAKEYNGVIYIVSVLNKYKENGDINPEETITEIGTYPGIAWPEFAEGTVTGDFHYGVYTPLKNIVELNNDRETRYDFNCKGLGYTTKTPVTIEIQPSYDGSVNLILVADGVTPRIINSDFSTLSDKRYKIIDRKQQVKTNQYNYFKIADQTELVRMNDGIVTVDLEGVMPGGQFKGGNYTFYIKFGDSDYNETDVVAESGIVSVFKGNDGMPSTISGTLLDERTDKMVGLKINGLNHIYSKIYIYYSREYSDTQGLRLTEYGRFVEPFDMNPLSENQIIWLSGYEDTEGIDQNEINIDYHTIDWARAEAQNSNILFLGNVGQKETFELYRALDRFTKLRIDCSIKQGDLNITDGGDDFSKANYYSTKNIYYTLGYWPEEYYRFGVVYVLNDGSTTPVFNVRGNVSGDGSSKNDYGVFYTPRLDVLKSRKPIYFEFSINSNEALFKLDAQYKNKIKGWFIVRQKRIPTTICQGPNLKIDKRSHLPLVYDGKDWIIQSFISVNRERIENGEVSKNGALLEIFYNRSLKYERYNYAATEVAAGHVSVESKIDQSEGFINGLTNYTSLAGHVAWPEHTPTTDDIYIFDEATLEKYKEVNSGELQIRVFRNLWEYSDDQFSPLEKYMYYFYDSDVYEGTNDEISGKLFDESKSYKVSTNTEIVDDWKLNAGKTNYAYRLIRENDSKYHSGSGILCLEPCVNPFIKSMLDGSEFEICKEYDFSYDPNADITGLLLNKAVGTWNSNPDHHLFKTVYIADNTLLKLVDETAFSNVAGNLADASAYKYTSKALGIQSAGVPGYYILDSNVEDDVYGTKDYVGFNSTRNINLVRGLFTPYVGITGTLSETQEDGLYSIRLKSIESTNAYLVRKQDTSPYYCVSERKSINDTTINAYRGDCYICKVGMRILRNFIDNTAPVADVIVDPTTWAKNVTEKARYDSENIAKYSDVNISDLNAVDLGYWVSYPCLSTYNLGLRSVDTFNTTEMALLGQPRSFYPLNGASTAAGNKLQDSFLLNDGLSATVGEKRYIIMPDDSPYTKSEFSNRIIFSNINVDNEFSNGYRTFQGISYRDFDKQYGAITKLISLGQNLFVVMEHGLGLIPVNPKALIQTTTGEAIHIYGYGVLPNEMQIISQDFGSKYEHSVIRTPIGVYGIDTDARKIWVFGEKQGFKTISDMNVESYLNDNLFTDKSVNIQTVDIRSHYNATKGDVMFTFYNIKTDE